MDMIGAHTCTQHFIPLRQVDRKTQIDGRTVATCDYFLGDQLVGAESLPVATVLLDSGSILRDVPVRWTREDLLGRRCTTRRVVPYVDVPFIGGLVPMMLTECMVLQEPCEPPSDVEGVRAPCSACVSDAGSRCGCGDVEERQEEPEAVEEPAPPKPRGPHPLVVDFDRARPWSVPFVLKEGETYVRVAAVKRRRSLSWLQTLDGLRLVATCYRRRLELPDQWIQLDRLMGRAKGAAMPLVKQYAKAQVERAEYISELPALEPLPPTQVDCDDATGTARTFCELLVSLGDRFAKSWPDLADECPDAAGWLGVAHTDDQGKAVKWELLSGCMDELADTLSVKKRALVQSLGRARRIEKRPTGARIRNLWDVRTPQGKRRTYRILRSRA